MKSPFALLQEGHRLENTAVSYELCKKVGIGPYGPYWSAKLRSNSGPATHLICFILTKPNSDGHFQPQINALKTLSSERLVEVQGFIRLNDDVIGIIYPFIDATPLSRLINSGSVQRLTTKQKHGLLKQAATVLDDLWQAEQQHCEFSPENLLVSKTKGVQLIGAQWKLKLDAQTVPQAGSTSNSMTHTTFSVFSTGKALNRLTQKHNKSLDDYRNKQADLYSFSVLALGLLSNNALKTLKHTKELHSHLAKSTHLTQHQTEVFEAIFDEKQRATIVQASTTPCLTLLKTLFSDPTDPMADQDESLRTPESKHSDSLNESPESQLDAPEALNTSDTSPDSESDSIQTPSAHTTEPQTSSAANDIPPPTMATRVSTWIALAIALLSFFGAGYWFGLQQSGVPTALIKPVSDANLTKADTLIGPTPLPNNAPQTAPALSPINSLTTQIAVQSSVSTESDQIILTTVGQQEKPWAFRDPFVSSSPQLTGAQLPEQTSTNAYGPVMIKLPQGRFTMGDQYRLGDDNEAVNVEISVNHPFAISQTEVTFAQYDAFAIATQRSLPDDAGWGRGQRPVINVSWQDANAYSLWLSEQTGQSYRLPTEAEWEYAARAGSQTAYSWGQTIQPGFGVCHGCLNDTGTDGVSTGPVKHYSPNLWNIYDTAGNVNEWVSDCYQDSHAGRPVLAKSNINANNCSARVLKGGSWFDISRLVRPATRYRQPPNTRNSEIGFRVALDF